MIIDRQLSGGLLAVGKLARDGVWEVKDGVLGGLSATLGWDAGAGK